MEVFLLLWDELDDLVHACRHKLLGPDYPEDEAVEVAAAGPELG
jgi:hypothetical protein